MHDEIPFDFYKFLLFDWFFTILNWINFPSFCIRISKKRESSTTTATYTKIKRLFIVYKSFSFVVDFFFFSLYCKYINYVLHFCLFLSIIHLQICVCVNILLIDRFCHFNFSLFHFFVFFFFYNNALLFTISLSQHINNLVKHFRLIGQSDFAFLLFLADWPNKRLRLLIVS